MNKKFLRFLNPSLTMLLILISGCAPAPTVTATLPPKATETKPPQATETTAPTTVPPTAQPTPDPINPVVTNCNITPPPKTADTPLKPNVISRDLPCGFTFAPPPTLDNLQLGFDFYSWLTFVALNSPAGSDKLIGQGDGKGGDARAVWEEWKEHYEVMLPDGGKPAPWGTHREIPAACEGLAANAGEKLVMMVGKTPDVLIQTNQPFDTGPLIDQSGEYVRYEILVNQPMFEYIVHNQLYNQEGQAKFTSTIVFPEGAVTNDTTGTIGAIIIKAAWKVLGTGDDQAKFHTTKALVYTPASENPKIDELCTEKTLGLVGLHVAHKTQVEPQWIWSTFEHKDNVPTMTDVKDNKFQKAYNFFKQACANAACPINQPPPRPWDPNVVPFPKGFTSQIVRFADLTQEVRDLNNSFQSLLKGTVWENYMLVSTQWPTDGTSKTDPTGAPAPVFLANTTMETYIQGDVPQSSSSCMDCHNNATDTQGQTSDFTYLLERAKKAKP